MADRTMKQGDTTPPLPIQLRLPNGQPVDLTDVDTILVKLVSPSWTIECDPENVVIEGSPDEGNGYYELQPGDLDVPGLYQLEYTVTWLDGRVRTFPTKGYLTVEVLPTLPGGAG